MAASLMLNTAKDNSCIISGSNSGIGTNNANNGFTRNHNNDKNKQHMLDPPTNPRAAATPAKTPHQTLGFLFIRDSCAPSQDAVVVCHCVTSCVRPISNNRYSRGVHPGKVSLQANGIRSIRKSSGNFTAFGATKWHDNRPGHFALNL